MRAGCLLKLPSGGSVCYAWDLWYSAEASFTERYRTPLTSDRTELLLNYISLFSGFQMKGFCFKLGLEQLFWWRSLLTECLLHSRLSIYASVSSHMLLSCQACSSTWTGLHGKRGGHVGWKRCLARAMRIIFFVYGAKKIPKYQQRQDQFANLQCAASIFVAISWGRAVISCTDGTFLSKSAGLE